MAAAEPKSEGKVPIGGDGKVPPWRKPYFHLGFTGTFVPPTIYSRGNTNYTVKIGR
jgi:hypothetical protein